MASGENGPTSLQLVGATDEICSACPHNKGGSCESAEKVDRYDAGVLKYTGLKAGQEMTFAEFERIVEEKILQPGYARSSVETAVERYLPQIAKSAPPPGALFGASIAALLSHEEISRICNIQKHARSPLTAGHASAGTGEYEEQNGTAKEQYSVDDGLSEDMQS